MGMASVWASGRGSGISPQTAHGVFMGRSGQIGCGWGNREDAWRLWADRLWLGEPGGCWEALWSACEMFSLSTPLSLWVLFESSPISSLRKHLR